MDLMTTLVWQQASSPHIYKKNCALELTNTWPVIQATPKHVDVKRAMPLSFASPLNGQLWPECAVRTLVSFFRHSLCIFSVNLMILKDVWSSSYIWEDFSFLII